MRRENIEEMIREIGHELNLDYHFFKPASLEVVLCQLAVIKEKIARLYDGN